MMRLRLYALGTVLGGWLLAAALASPAPAQTAPASSASSASLPQFEDVTAKSGIHFRHSFGEKELRTILEGTGSGCAWLDYNNDGLLDLYVVNGRHIDGLTNHSAPDGVDATNHLYRNNGDGTFTDVTVQAGVAGKGFGVGVTVGDFDNDGYEDIYVTNYNSAILYHNNGNGSFSDVTAKAGADNPYFGTGAAWLDYDRDGRLDLFIGNYLQFNPNYNYYYSAENYPGPLSYAPERNRLLHNNGDGTFTDVSRASGISAQPGRAMGITVGDFNNDGWPDIYVANDTMASYLYRNNHDGTFTNVAADFGVDYGQNGEETTAMGPVFGDYDNDGWPDLFVSDAHYHRLYHNSGKAEGMFQDVTDRSGIGAVSGQYAGWGSGFFDFDNDGYKDLFIVNGGMSWPVPMQSILLHNNGKGIFTDVSAQAGGFFKEQIVGRGACFADYDNDGFIDAYITTLNGEGVLLHNTPPAGKRNHWLTIRLAGTRSNRDGLGASIEISAGGQHQFVQSASESGYLSQSDPRPHFGLGQHTQVDTLTIHWPSGTVQTLHNIAADQILTVKEPAAPASGIRPVAAKGKQP